MLQNKLIKQIKLIKLFSQTLSFKILFPMLVVLMTSTLFPLSVLATVKNPQIRLCQELNGEYVVLKKFGFEQVDDIGFCQFHHSLVSTLALLDLKFQNQRPFAIDAYLNGVQKCAYGPNSDAAQIIQLVSLDGMVFTICQFADSSYIDLPTLLEGKNNPQQQNLNTALGL